MEAPQKRQKNWTDDEAIFLAREMGETHAVKTHLSNYQVLRHRFGSGITTQTKKDVFVGIEGAMKAAGYLRSKDEIEKKWKNLSSRSKTLYSEHSRGLLMTGGGTSGPSLSAVTEAVMDVVGRQSVSVMGIEGGIDSSELLLNSLINGDSSMDIQMVDIPVIPVNLLTDDTSPQTQQNSTPEVVNMSPISSTSYTQMPPGPANSQSAHRKRPLSESIGSNAKRTCTCKNQSLSNMERLAEKKLELEVELLHLQVMHLRRQLNMEE